MNTYNFSSNSINDTLMLGKNLASLLKKGDLVVLSGELGAGKTKFTEGFLKFFNLEDEISSPTFNIVNEYKKDDISIYHFDVYRLEDVAEFYEIGGDEYFENDICLIEWGELIKDALPKSFISIDITKLENDENKRLFRFISQGERYDKILENLKSFYD